MAESQGLWYVAHTYSGYENKVKVDIEKTIENRHMEDQIFEVSVPLMKVVEVKNGVERTVDKKMFPGYVFIRMINNSDTWYVVRNTRGVTGFVGPGREPSPLTPEEMVAMGFGVPEGTVLHEKRVLIDFAVGDSVRVTTGAWKDTVGIVKSINENRKTVAINVDLFGRETSVELGFGDVKKL